MCVCKGWNVIALTCLPILCQLYDHLLFISHQIIEVWVTNPHKISESMSYANAILTQLYMQLVTISLLISLCNLLFNVDQG